MTEEQFDKHAVEYEKSLKSAEDLLASWQVYIQWVQDACPTSRMRVVALLDRAIKSLCKMDQYKDDERLLDLVLLYADKASNPISMFRYLNTNKIGVQYAKFYVRWALYLEDNGDAAKANKIYEEGIKRKAQPEMFMKTKHKQFQKRLIQQIQAAAKQPAATKRSGIRRRGALASRSSQRRPLGRVSKPNKENQRTNVVIHVDKEFSASAQPSLKKTLAELSTHHSWTEFPSILDQEKENEQAPSKWSEVTLADIVQPSPPSAEPEFKVFQD
eukprot:TRINITY_DN17912_c0_g1_i1.p1 TRINITY_DN17912_c0_g1~~TRINITY_DN17912_c0_g1_i1.p1  ORF type:complete len:320 (+),score=39.18 TRINITY_DN17912_c0_g1_i1:147-962(+)